MFSTYTIKDLERGVRTDANTFPPGYLCEIPESGGEVVTTWSWEKSESGIVERVERTSIKPIPINGWELAEPLHESDKLPDLLPHIGVMISTCEDWLSRRGVRLDDSIPGRVAVPIDNGKQVVVWSGRDCIEIPGTGTAIYLVVRQWVEDEIEPNFQKLITQTPAWESAVEHAAKLFEPFTHPDLPGSQETLLKEMPGSANLPKGNIFVNGVSLEHILTCRNLPDTPGTCDCLFAEAFNSMCRRHNIDPIAHKFAPRRGLLVETLFVAPCSPGNDRQTGTPIPPPEDALGSVISSVVAPAQWAGGAWARVGTVVNQHKDWWKNFDFTKIVMPKPGRPSLKNILLPIYKNSPKSNADFVALVDRYFDEVNQQIVIDYARYSVKPPLIERESAERTVKRWLQAEGMPPSKKHKK